MTQRIFICRKPFKFVQKDFSLWGKMKNEITHEIKFLGQISIKVE